MIVYKLNINNHKTAFMVFMARQTRQKQQVFLLTIRNLCFLKGHVKIMLLPVIALSFPHFCPKLEQTLHIHQEQHSWHAGNIFFKQCIEIPKNAILCVRVVSDQLFNVNGPLAQAQRDELVTRLSSGEMMEFLQDEEFVL